ncbi:putative pentatricopeptide repeat-containing protein At3g15200 isoform X3 [Euphorbia lathyris]|uniref:putative pentatricopeptide repeat-containing protein At3g15200 isoform X3 n=1 Tax=Euphorbia lathyris TaxID=212925 RepID=UPI0033133352
MPYIIQHLKAFSRESFYSKTKFVWQTNSRSYRPLLLYVPHNQNSQKNHCQTLNFRLSVCTVTDSHSVTEATQNSVTELAIKIQNVLKKYRDCPTRKIELALNQCSPMVTEDLIMNVLKRHRSDWKQAYIFFNWVSKGGQTFINSTIYNEILDILGKMRHFSELTQVLDEMSKREGIINEETYRIIVNRYKHVEVAESLLYSGENDFGMDIKTMNIVLNGWCVLGNVHEAKRFFRDIVGSECNPDLFTFGTLIKALTKKGKLGTAVKIYRSMWNRQLKPDVVICNCMIDALCFKKRVPDALEVFREMTERGCLPNVATYNSLIKHLCKIRRMEKVYELLDEMLEKKGNCIPDDITFNYLLKSLRKPEELPLVLEKMEKCNSKLNDDTYNLILKLYVDWDCEERARDTWNEMEKHGLGPDRRSYTVMIHWLYDKGRIEDALRYFEEMISKGMVPEPRTQMLVNKMNTTVEKNEAEQEGKGAIRSDYEQKDKKDKRVR